MRVLYRGRDDGWVLTSNKRGPTMEPVAEEGGGDDDIARAFEEQEASLAAAAAAEADRVTDDDRPLMGAAKGGVTSDAEERALSGAGERERSEADRESAVTREGEAVAKEVVEDDVKPGASGGKLGGESGGDAAYMRALG